MAKAAAAAAWCALEQQVRRLAEAAAETERQLVDASEQARVLRQQVRRQLACVRDPRNRTAAFCAQTCVD